MQNSSERNLEHAEVDSNGLFERVPMTEAQNFMQQNLGSPSLPEDAGELGRRLQIETDMLFESAKPQASQYQTPLTIKGSVSNSSTNDVMRFETLLAKAYLGKTEQNLQVQRENIRKVSGSDFVAGSLASS